MPTYVVHQRIDTLLELWNPFTFDGFNFSAWSIDYTSGRQDGWLAEKTVEANSIEEAFNIFSARFHQLVDRIAFIGQCHTTAELETFMITKPGDDRIFYRYAEKRKPVPLHFNQEQINSLQALEGYAETGDAFRYLREATNATSFYTMLVMLVSALEAMAGTTDENGKRVVKRGIISDEILKDTELCDRLFKYGEGIRNQILHGGFVDQGMHGVTNYNSLIYNAIIDYFNSKWNLEIDKNARGRPRTITGHYDVWSGWLHWKNKDLRPTLQLLNEKFKATDAPAFYERLGAAPRDF